MVEKMPEMAKPEMPQINPITGISKDYINQFAALISMYDFRGISMIKKHLEIIPFKVRSYADIYARYNNVVNDKNRDTIVKLDNLSFRLQDILKDPESIDEDEFRKIINEVCFLIYGDDQVKI